MEFTLAALTLLVATLLLVRLPGSTGRDGTAARLTEIERRLQLVMDHPGVVDDGPALPGVREHLARGEKIKAIQAYRAATGADLKTAKEAVEAMARHR
ncbi:hypothetical protein [Micromonospora psammae]|uniref:hypothetical protein n=1 Tax=Micromonospora sp. CPCC 205556 TaxID=3122398 RepID=UPI002FF3D474